MAWKSVRALRVLLIMIFLISILVQLIQASHDENMAPTSFGPSSPPIAVYDHFPTKLGTASHQGTLGPMGDCLKKIIRRCGHFKKLGRLGMFTYEACILYKFGRCARKLIALRDPMAVIIDKCMRDCNALNPNRNKTVSSYLSKCYLRCYELNYRKH